MRPIELAIDELKGQLAVEQGDYRVGLPLLQKAGGVNPVYLAKVEFLAGDREAAAPRADGGGGSTGINFKCNRWPN